VKLPGFGARAGGCAGGVVGAADAEGVVGATAGGGTGAGAGAGDGAPNGAGDEGCGEGGAAGRELPGSDAKPNSAVKPPVAGLGGGVGGGGGGAWKSGGTGGAVGGSGWRSICAAAIGGGATGRAIPGGTVCGASGSPNKRVKSPPSGCGAAGDAVGAGGVAGACGPADGARPGGGPVRITTVVCTATADSSHSRRFAKSGRNSVTMTGSPSTSTRASTVVARDGSASTSELMRRRSDSLASVRRCTITSRRVAMTCAR
jgi:hypothetical protein